MFGKKEPTTWKGKKAQELKKTGGLLVVGGKLAQSMGRTAESTGKKMQSLGKKWTEK